MRDRDGVAVDRIMPRDGIARRAGPGCGDLMGDDLVAIEVEVDPFAGAAPLGTAKHGAVEMARGVKVADREGEMKGARSDMSALLEDRARKARTSVSVAATASALAFTDWRLSIGVS